MPIYEYECELCGHALDALQKLSDEPLRDCPACSKPALRKRVSAPRFRLKGSGWYETDFKQGNRRNIADGGDGGNGAEKKAAKKEEKNSGTAASSVSAGTSTPSSD
jgi:putative FmdB family regulatory protein